MEVTNAAGRMLAIVPRPMLNLFELPKSGD